MKRSLTVAIGCLAVAATTGCGRAEEKSEPRFWPTAKVVRNATKAETTRLLIEGNLRELEGVVDSRRPIFYPSGRYMQAGYATVEGHYTVEGNVFCMSIGKNDPDALCRAVNITPTGPVVVAVKTKPAG